MSRVLTVALVGAVCLFAGCDKETTLHSGLAEQQANLVMAALLDGEGRQILYTMGKILLPKNQISY